MQTGGTSAPIDRLPPQSPDAEEAVLGSCLIGAEAMHAVRALLTPADFYRERNATIYGAMCRLCDARSPVDFMTLTDELTRSGEYEEAGGLSYLSHLTEVVPTFVHAEHYAEIVARCAVKRRGISASGEIARLFYDETLTAEEAQARAMALLMAVRATASRYRIHVAAELAGEFLDMADALCGDDPGGLATGLLDLDKILDPGLEPGDLVVLLADTSLGKSALAQSIGRNVGRAGGDTLYCSVEMSRRQLIQRNAAALLGMSWQEFRYRRRNGLDAVRLAGQIARAADAMREGRLHVYYKPTMSILDIRMEALKWRAMHDLALLVVDYVQILTMPKAESRRIEVERAFRELKALAGELAVPVLALCQLNREFKGRNDKRPSLHDARESGSIEQDSDILLGLYRDDFFYRVGCMNDRKQSVIAGKAELLVLKHRKGPTGSLDLTWRPETCEYCNYNEEMPD